MTSLYITGAGVSKQSGIPTFRGEDGFWTIGSVNYTHRKKWQHARCININQMNFCFGIINALLRTQMSAQTQAITGLQING